MAELSGERNLLYEEKVDIWLHSLQIETCQMTREHISLVVLSRERNSLPDEEKI